MNLEFFTSKSCKSCTLGLLTALLLPFSAQANDTNLFGTLNGDVDYTNGWEGYAEGFLVTDGDGTNGWYGAESNSIVITTNLLIGVAPKHPYMEYGGKPPLPTNTTHTSHLKIAQITSEATNLVTGSETEFYIDMLLKPLRWDREDNPTGLPDDKRAAMFFNSNGYLTAFAKYHRDAGTVSNRWETNWVTFTGFELPTNKWVRLTIEMDMEQWNAEDYYKIKLNGATLSHPMGAVSTTQGDRTNNPGPWLQCPDASANSLNSIGFRGTGYLDDLVVTTVNPLPGEARRVTVSIHPPGSAITTPGGIENSGTITFEDEDATAQITTTCDGIPVWFMNYTNINYTRNGLLTNSTGWPNNMSLALSYASIGEDHTLVISNAGTPRTVIITNVGEVGTLVPTEGKYTYAYGDSVTSTIYYAAASNSATHRHTANWEGQMNPTTPSGSGTPGQTNYTVVYTIGGEDTQIAGTPTNLSLLAWDMYLEHKLDMSNTAPEGIVSSDILVSPSGWYDNQTTIVVEAIGLTSDSITNSSWTGDTAGTTPSNGFSELITPMSEPRSIVAAFTYADLGLPDWTLSVTNELGYGTPIPAAGDNAAGDGDLTNCLIIAPDQILGGGTQFVCTGWTGTGRVPSTGSTTNTGMFLMTSNSTVTWVWEKQHLISASSTGSVASAGGIVSPASGYYTVDTDVALTATPNIGSMFNGWDGDIAGIADTSAPSVTVTADVTKVLRATFEPSGTNSGSRGSTLAFYSFYNLEDDYQDYEVAETDDADGDGELNWQEYVAGTDPDDSNSIFRVLSQTYTNGTNYVVWYGTKDYVTNYFSLLRSTNLITGWDWVQTNAIPRASSGTNTWADPVGVPAYYRPSVIWTY